MSNVRQGNRKQAEKRGHRAETLAALYLRLKGYRILAKRFKTKLGEIDIIATKGDLVAMVEVKARRTVQEAVDSVTATAQHRIHNSADLWLGKQRNAERLSIRFDIIAICPKKWPSHFKDAF